MSPSGQLALVVLVTAGFLVLPATTRPTLPFGVRVPPGRSAEPLIGRVRRGYRIAAAVLGGVAVAVLLVGGPALGGAMPAALVLLDGTAFWLASRRIAAAARAGGWTAGAPSAVVADTSLRTHPARPSAWWLAPAVGLLIGTGVLGLVVYPSLPATLPTVDGLVLSPEHRVATTPWTAAWPVTNQLVATAIGVLTAAVLPRLRPELDPADPVGSARRYRSSLRGTIRMAAVTAAALDLALLALALPMWQLAPPSPAWTAVAAAPVAAALAGWAVWAVRSGDAGHRLPGPPPPTGGPARRDDDRHWHLAGTVYANRADPAIMVHQRVGGRWTLNLGHPASWAFLAVLATVAVLATTGRA